MKTLEYFTCILYLVIFTKLNKLLYCCCLDRLFVTAWKPDLTFSTEHRLPHVPHCRKKRRFSRCKLVSGERQV